MTYAFHTPDKLCFILDLMNGKVTSVLWNSCQGGQFGGRKKKIGLLSTSLSSNPHFDLVHEVTFVPKLAYSSLPQYSLLLSISCSQSRRFQPSSLKQLNLSHCSAAAQPWCTLCSNIAATVGKINQAVNISEDWGCRPENSQ